MSLIPQAFPPIQTYSLETNVLSTGTGDTITISPGTNSNDQFSILNISNPRTDGIVAINFTKNSAVQGNLLVDTDNSIVLNNTDNVLRISTNSGLVNIGGLIGAQKLNVGGNIYTSGGLVFDTGASVYKIYSNKNIGVVSGGVLTFVLPTQVSYTKVVSISVFCYNNVNQVEQVKSATVVIINNTLTISNATPYNTFQMGCMITYTL